MAFLHLPPRRRRPAVASTVAFAGLCCLSLLHVYPLSPGILFARYWMPIAVTLTGAAAYVLWQAIGRLSVGIADLRSLPFGSYSDRARMLSPSGWRLAAVMAVALLVMGMAGHFAKGLYAIERARIMIGGRQDYVFERAQPASVMRDGCGTVWYSRAEVMHAYWLYGMANCGTFLAVARDTEMLAAKHDVTHAVSMSPMSLFQGWQPIGLGEAVSLQSEGATDTSCWPVDTAAPVRVRLRSSVAHAIVSIEGGSTKRQIEIGRSPQWIDLGVMEIGESVRLSANDAIAFGGDSSRERD